jgi:3-phenylpropionate/cinnamic acid dioxygenase small subunit
MTREQAEEFLNLEARLLDQRRYEEWLELFTEDGYYWLPMDEGADPETEASILYDDSTTRAQRVYQLVHEPHWSQLPPSRTMHAISNVQVYGAGETEATVHCNLIVCELRPGDQRQLGLGQQRFFAGHCEYSLRHENGWRMAVKKVVLLSRDVPLENLTFII